MTLDAAGPARPAAAPAEPFFLPAAGGARFCLYHPPALPPGAAPDACRGALVYLHPFAEEMNRSRRMAALQSRALAARGYAVLQIDLLGCGDSSGDFADARWECWRDDVALAAQWLRRRVGREPALWGLRLGALLALDCARHAAVPPPWLLLWQPVQRGALHLTQFLRLRLAADMLGQQAARTSTAALRAVLASGAPLEVAGYELAPALAGALDRLDMAALAPACPVHWFELAPDAGRGLSPASNSAVQAWHAAGVAVTPRLVAGPAFWGTAETTVSPALLAGTCGVLDEAGHAL